MFESKILFTVFSNKYHGKGICFYFSLEMAQKMIDCNVKFIG